VVEKPAISPEAIRNRRSVFRGSLKETSGCLLWANKETQNKEAK